MNHLDNFLTTLRDHGYEPVQPLRIDGSSWGRLMFNGESKSKASGGYKLIENPDGSLFANYGTTKDEFRSWRSDSTRELSYEEMTAERSARISHRKFLDEKERVRHQKIGRLLERAYVGNPVAVAHPYLTDKRISPNGIRMRKKTGELLIPRFGVDGRFYSLQRIVQSKPGVKSWKGYFKGALGKSLYYPILAAVEDPWALFVLCEGFATGCSIHRATGLSVIVCFDTAGLMGVARGMREKYPHARILIAADNDQWTFEGGKKPALNVAEVSGDDPRWAEWRELDKLYNPGVEKAQAAAAAIGGAQVLIPDFSPDCPKKYTDFNDLANELGDDHVAKMFRQVLEIPLAKAAEEAGAQGFGGPSSDVQTLGASDISNDGPSLGDMGMPFRVLGYNNGEYYYYPFGLRQIVSMSAPGHTMPNLLQLAPLEKWEAKWRDVDHKLMAKHQTIALTAAAWLTELAEKRGVFVEEAHVRGAGCWIDDGRVVLHCGDSLYVEGINVPFNRMTSEFTYVAAPRLMRPARTELSNVEARKLRTICESITWENPLSGTLLAGWLVIAPVCAALSYRPHIYITGEAESGKSTVMDKIIKPVLGRMALCLDGGTSEPSVRQQMRYDARPLVYDEAEPSPMMIDVIGLARKATTGSVVKKFGQPAFKARFCACFSAINPPVNKTADESRISFMHLKKNRRPAAIEEYDQLLEMIEETITPDFSERMIARTLQNMNSLIANIRIFQRVVRKQIGGARASQQVGTMMAGVYMLGRTDIISEEKAAEIVGRFSWSDHTIIDDQGDPLRLVQWIAGSLVRTRSGETQSIGDLVQAVVAKHENCQIADKQLRHYGISVKGPMVEVAARSQNLARLLKDTEWQEKWSRTLSDVPGAERRKIAYFAPGIKTSAVALPVGLFTEADPSHVAPMAMQQVDDDPNGWWERGRE